ncbi:hypothetical protein ACJMK2_034851 [Sinanodonta woodiana]|uniref:Uncharacterized protein n=1 Tax=Sinanodonta woodiana TaxID=1069815 RepID=A0ABD3WUF3_SINWO
MVSPFIMIMSLAVGAGALGSLLIIIAMSADTWESVTFRMDVLSQYTNKSSINYYVELATSDSDFSKFSEMETIVVNGSKQSRLKYTFLYTMYTGLWRTCDILTDASRHELETLKGRKMKRCYVFFSEYDEEDDNLPNHMKRVGRLQTSAASCVIVSFIIMMAASVVGTISIVLKLVSACMVTGALYFMAGLFCAFGLTIFHTKVYYEKYQCCSFFEEAFPGPACDARVIEIGWAIVLSWVYVVVCIIVSTLWIFVMRTFRFIKSKSMM